MTGKSLPERTIHPVRSAETTVPIIEIDWDHLLEQRKAVLAHSEMPAYLLLPEIHQLLALATHDNTRLLLSTLWHTGGRISEVLALTPRAFVLDNRQPYVSLATLKRRGRPSSKQAAKKPRLVPISDERYQLQLKRYFKTQRLRQDELIFPIQRGSANKRLSRLITHSALKPLINITPHTFRHSFAVNAVLHGIPLPVVQGWLGHADIASTLIYTQVLTLETHHLMQRIRF